MFYILPLNSNMLSSDWAGLITAGTDTANIRWVNGVEQILLYGDVWATVDQVRAAVFAATAVSAGITTLIMGFYGKLPVGLASGLGINSLIAYTVMLGMGSKTRNIAITRPFWKEKPTEMIYTVTFNPSLGLHL